jgi:oxygen-independent coproporphyrinogen III oxidase
MAGIYIHIPFCKKLCSYCDFYKIISPEDYTSFIDALITEAEIRKNYLAGEVVSTIYLGGGTPSVLSLETIHKILDRLSDLFTIDKNCEITVELNPDDLDITYLKGLKKININRVSLGIQSWRDEDLVLLNRRHNAAQAEKALENTFSAGFENVTVDLIYGIPGLSSSEWISNLDKTFSFGINHLSAYHLTIEPGTVFGKMKEKGLLSEIDEEESANQFNILIEKAERAGFIHYEISNFGREGFFSQHNTNYWKQVNYLGLGPSAHSFNNYSRQWNIKNVKNYISSIKNKKPFYEGEELNVRTRFNEYIMTSLRTMWGIDLEFIEKTFEKEGYDYIINTAGKFKNYGLIKQERNNLILTNQGKMISDNIISEFMMPGDE